MKQKTATILIALLALITAWGGHIYAQPPTAHPDKGGSPAYERWTTPQSGAVSQIPGWLVSDGGGYVRLCQTCGRDMLPTVSGHLPAGRGSSSPGSRGDVLQDKRHDLEPAGRLSDKMGDRDNGSHCRRPSDTEIHGIFYPVPRICQETWQRRQLVRLGTYNLTSGKEVSHV